MRNLSLLGACFTFCIVTISAGKITIPNVVEENFRKLGQANNELAFNLYRKLASSSAENVFFSPLSISTLLGMIFYGARGETSEELRKVLGYKKAELLNNLVHETFGHYFKDVLKSGDSSDEYVLNSANSILADKSLQLLEEYRNNVSDLYRATIRNVDFSKEAPKLVEEINNWVKEKTNGKIEKFLDQLSPATALVLLNAVYFKGTWKTEFDPKKTRKAIFYNNGLLSEAKNVTMMHINAFFPVFDAGDYKILVLPYKGENVSMYILLPNKRDGLQALEENLTSEKLNNIFQFKMYESEVEVFLPKFKLELEREISGDLQALGAKQIFSGEADFSGMTQSKSVPISQILHKAVIEVNEKGSEAAAVTGTVPYSLGIDIRADHPFLFAIVEKGSKSNMVLFMGRVNNL